MTFIKCVTGDTQYVRFGNNKMVQRDIWTEISAVVLLNTGNTCQQSLGELSECCVTLSKITSSHIYKVSEYDQEIPQAYTADQPTAQLGRATEHL